MKRKKLTNKKKIIPKKEKVSVITEIILFFKKRKKSISLISLILSFLIIIIPFLLKRLPFYLYAPIITFRGDSSTYFKAMQEIGSGNFPHFEIRTPGYPFFLKFITSFHDSVVAISFYQSLFTLLSSLFLIYVIHKLFPYISVLFAFMLTIFINSVFYFTHETTYLTENLFINSIFIFIAFALLSIHKPKSILNAVLLSLTVFIAIMVKPASLILLPILILIIIYMLFNKYSRNIYIALITPVFMLLLIFSAYNYFVSGFFKISAFGSINMLGATIKLQEQDSTYLVSVNKAIEKYSTPKANYGTCHKINNFLLNSKEFKDETDSLFPGVQKNIILERIYNEIAIDAIKKHPNEYAQIVWVQFQRFFHREFIYSGGNSFDNQLRYRCQEKYLKPSEFKKKKADMQRDLHYQTIQVFPEFIDVKNNKVYFNIKHKALIKYSHNFESFITRNTQFTSKTIYLKYLLFISIFVSLFLLILQKGKNKKVFIVLLISSIALLKGLLIALVETSINRYAYTMSFIEYFSIIFTGILLFELFLMIKAKKNKIEKK